MSKVTFDEVRELLEKCGEKGLTVGEGKRICREFRDKHGLTDMEVLNIVNRRF